MIKVLVGIATSKDAQAGPRVSAATALLDRGWGKPEAHVQLGVTDDVTAFIRQLQQGPGDNARIIEGDEQAQVDPLPMLEAQSDGAVESE